jgi:hypothetical protein
MIKLVVTWRLGDKGTASSFEVPAVEPLPMKILQVSNMGMERTLPLSQAPLLLILMPLLPLGLKVLVMDIMATLILQGGGKLHFRDSVSIV